MNGVQQPKRLFWFTVFSALSVHVFALIEGLLNFGYLPLFMVSFLCALGGLILLAAKLVGALFQKNHLRTYAIQFPLALTLTAASFFCTPAPFFKAGFKARIKMTFSAEELHQIAKVARNIVPPRGRISSPTRDRSDIANWTKLATSTAINKLTFMAGVCVEKDDVSIVYGAALPGHWGVIISNTNSPRFKLSSRDDIAPGIRTFYGE
jgi:hypothetical protein